jgi:hypothetical protein
MYCPSCGSNNKTGIRFCTRCGTNLAAVEDALGGKPARRSEIDDRTVKLLKDYYDGRRSTAVGAVSLTLGLLLLTPLLAMDWMDKLAVIGLFGLGCLVYGAIALIAGIAAWIQSSSEMKALELTTGRSLMDRPAREALATAPDELATGAARGYSTDPIVSPASVTEQTTRQLDQQAVTPSLEVRSKTSD